MKRHRLPVLFVSAGLALLAVLLLAHRHAGNAPAPPHDVVQSAAVVRHSPSLYCDFYDFMHAAVVVSFEFGVSFRGDMPIFKERFEQSQDDARRTFENEHPAIWIYAVDDGTPTIAAPDGESHIVLYGLKRRAAGVFWTEAGLRSNQYRNLEGKCRQAHFDAERS